MARAILKTLGLAGAALTAWYFLDPKKGSEKLRVALRRYRAFMQRLLSL